MIMLYASDSLIQFLAGIQINSRNLIMHILYLKKQPFNKSCMSYLQYLIITE